MIFISFCISASFLLILQRFPIIYNILYWDSLFFDCIVLMTVVFDKSKYSGESNVFLDDLSHWNKFLYKEYDKDMLGENDNNRILWKDYLRLYCLLHHIISKYTISHQREEPRYIRMSSDHVPENISHKQKHSIDSIAIWFLDLNPWMIYDATTIEDRNSVYVTNPSYETGCTLCELLTWTMFTWKWHWFYVENQQQNFLTDICHIVAQKLNWHLWKFWFIFCPEDLSSMNFKVKKMLELPSDSVSPWYWNFRLMLMCTDVGSSIARLVFRNRSVLHTVYQNPGKKKYEGLWVDPYYCSEALSDDFLKFSKALKQRK